MSHTISILIPAHNEEKMLGACLDSCLRQSRPVDQIIVVNDGSTDRTAEILSSYRNRITVVTNVRASGNKSRAQMLGMPYVTGDIVITTDADTILDTEFVFRVERAFADPNISAFAGYVKSMRHNYLTAMRELDYIFGQDLHKRAQSYLNYLLVIPGCAAAFRTYLFKENILTLEHDTVTEDLDLTYKLHLLGLRIYFDMNAIVYTQDPPTLYSYINQMRRWYGGSWQNLQKHTAVIRYPRAALVLSLSYIEGITFAFIFFVLPFIHLPLFLLFAGINMAFAVLIGLYAAVARKRFDLFWWSPLSIFLKGVNAAIFVEQFFIECILRRKNMAWYHPERIHIKHITPTS